MSFHLQNYKPFMCSLCQYKTGLRGNLDKHIRTVHNLDVVTKHTVHLKMKFKNRHSGDILTKDGEYINTVVDHRGEDPLRLQVNMSLTKCAGLSYPTHFLKSKGSVIRKT